MMYRDFKQTSTVSAGPDVSRDNYRYEGETAAPVVMRESILHQITVNADMLACLDKELNGLIEVIRPLMINYDVTAEVEKGYQVPARSEVLNELNYQANHIKQLIELVSKTKDKIQL
jgi:hypothetical protein